MAISKVIFNGTTLMDVTSDTVTASNLLSGYTAHDKSGSLITGTASAGGASPTLQTKSATPTESAQTITADSGYDGLSSVEIGAISATYVGSRISRLTASNLTGEWDSLVNKYYVSTPAGYYPTGGGIPVPSGTPGTPTATKGTVSGNSVSITPSVTNTSGYIRGSTINGTAVTVTASQLVSGTKSITANGTGIDVTNYASVDVSVPSANLQSKTGITPSESSQTITADSGYDGLSSVQINAISSTYVGSEVARNDSSDLTASGATVSVPAGYYAQAATKSVASGTAGTPTASKGTVSNHTITVTPSVTNTSGYITGGTINGTGVSVSASELVSGTLSITSSGTKDVTNYASVSVNAGAEGTPTATKGTVNNHAITITPSVTNTGGYITGDTKTGTAVTVSASELASGNKAISQNGTGIDVVGYSTVSVDVNPTLQAKTNITPTTSSQTITPDSGYDGLSSVQINAMPSGTAGTPSATKGTVSNHSVSVTPSVTNATGYITGGTKTGTAVTVSASELVSGTKSITSNGTGIDVTNYATVNVALEFSTITVSSSNPTGGNNGDIWIKTVS